jgi:murein DD-endopeptidase
MASSHLGDSWGTAIGVNSVGAYSAAAGARYLGWSMQYNGHGQQLSGGGHCGAASVPSGCTVPATPTSETGVPDGAFTMRLQMYAADHGYTGPIDGAMNAATWIGVQRGLASHGYTGPANGIPGANTYMAFQRVAAEHGYTGPINGVLGPNSYRGFAAFLNAAY